MRGIVVLLALVASPALAAEVTRAPGQVTVEMSPAEFRALRVDRGTALTAPEVRAGAASSGVRVVQAGRAHEAGIETGPGNRAVVVQTGSAHDATVSQTGTGQGVLLVQTGTGAEADIAQTEDGARVVVLQHGWEPVR